MKTHKFISYGITLIMRNILDKSCRKDQNTHFKFGNFFPKIVPFVRFGRFREATNDTLIWYVCFACGTTKATDIHSEFEILTAFPWQQ